MVAYCYLVGVGSNVAAGVGNLTDFGRIEYYFPEGIRFGDTDAHIVAIAADCAVCVACGASVGRP